MKISILLGAALFISTAMIIDSAAYANERSRNSVPKPQPVIYVTSQGLFYDSIVLADLPFKGNFQELEMDGPSGLQTEFGLGGLGYVGGRWWVDANTNDVMDADDVYFLCPLLGPGRANP